MDAVGGGYSDLNPIGIEAVHSLVQQLRPKLFFWYTYILKLVRKYIYLLSEYIKIISFAFQGHKSKIMEIFHPLIKIFFFNLDPQQRPEGQRRSNRHKGIKGEI